MTGTGRRVAIVGVGYSTVGRDTGLSLKQLIAQGAQAAMADGGVEQADIDGVAMHAFPPHFVPAYECGALLGLPSLKWTSGSIEGPAFLSAGIHAAAAVASGTADVVLALRPMLRLGATGPTPGASAAGGRQFLEPFGAGRPAQWAGMIKQRMMSEFGWGEEAFGRQMVAQREFAALNPDALLRERITLDDYMNTRYVAKPLRLLDCDYPVDSCGAVIFATEERARDFAQKPVFVESWSFGTSGESDFELAEDMTRTSSFSAAADMWARTSLTPEDVQVAGLYDGFSPITLNWMEALGLCGRGEASDFVAEGNTSLGGRVPVNCDGGATNVGRVHGVNHVAEVVRQLRGTSGDRQRPDAKVGVAANSIAAFTACMLMSAE
ncbi:thiolase family protein [Blastococcus sp. CT_GayMR16]|uniref:thiolase family protein n=1 Tax=Blastococcus sp. CT_GayMR16 TaxID=2559607 RepID=UPI001074577D|nr:thiolase family protein [Blastococcus sp. CT_GayMR16]TFV88838.1 thiolase family protein [Blastococcus sp. CT_GayMR16]